MNKVMTVLLVAGVAGIAAPALADDREVDRRQVERKNCSKAERCVGQPRTYPWFYLGRDEDVQSGRSVVRRISAEP